MEQSIKLEITAAARVIKAAEIDAAVTLLRSIGYIVTENGKENQNG